VPNRGEVWLVDFGITQKVRPALIISIPYADADRALIGVIPHTTATRGSQFEVPVPTPFLSEGAFLVQGMQAFPPKYFLRRLGVLSAEQMGRVEKILLYWQGLGKNEPSVNVTG
jgi:mRNA interferase MazF